MSGQQQSKKRRTISRDLKFARSKGGWGRSVILSNPVCPTPTKRIFDSRESAEREAGGKRVYRCSCGSFHLTNRGAVRR